MVNCVQRVPEIMMKSEWKSESCPMNHHVTIQICAARVPLMLLHGWEYHTGRFGVGNCVSQIWYKQSRAFTTRHSGLLCTHPLSACKARSLRMCTYSPGWGSRIDPLRMTGFTIEGWSAATPDLPPWGKVVVRSASLEWIP